MGLLTDAARTWNSLCQTAYRIELGRKGKRATLRLTFDSADFPHIVGMQYAGDVDFGLRPAQFYGKRLIPAVLDGRLEETRLYKSREWGRIEGRLKAIIGLPQTLEGKFVIAQFHPERVRGFCSIRAEYVIKNTVSEEVFFVFLDREQDRYFCRSAFQSNDLDYIENQPMMTVLEVAKETDSGVEILRRHPGFRA